MAADWRTATVADLQREGILLVEDGNHGESRPRPDEFVASGPSFIRAADMDAGRVLFESASKISEQARQRISKGIGAPGDVLLSHKGTVGKIALVPEDAPPFVCSPQTTFWRSLNLGILDRQYLHTFMRSSGFHSQLATRAGETDMAPYVSLTSQRGLSVTLPPIGIQRAIARVVGAFDRKVALIWQMNETLDTMVRAVFKDWFMNFGPTRAKAAVRPAYLPPEIWSFFPDALDSEGKPKGWNLSEIGKETRCVGGSTPSTTDPTLWNGGLQWATPKDLSSLNTPVLLSTERTISQKGLEKISSGLLPVGTVLLSSRAPIGYLAISEVPAAINQGFIALVPEGRLSSVFVWQWIIANMDAILQKANGSTFQEISKSSFRPLPVVVPSAPLLKAFEAIARPLYERIRGNEIETRSLVALRDFLLPKLISGKIQLHDAEKLARKVS
jgi:type I restriction enzyme, S subunit